MAGPSETVQPGSPSSSTPPSTLLTPETISDDDFDVSAELDGGHGIRLETLEPAKDWVSRGADGEEGDFEDDDYSDEDDKGGGPRARTASIQSFELYTPDEERAVVRKLDRKLVLFVAVLYMLSFLDRNNIGNANLAGMSEDLQISDAQFRWLLRSFYITYITFQWMTLLFQKLPAHTYLACVVTAWGLIASFQAMCNSFASLFALRFCLGISEAAFAGIPFFLTSFFRRDEMAYRTGLFISAAPVAGTFASSLAYLLVKLGDKTPISGWRLLFLAEGCPSLFIAYWVWYWIPDTPSTARWLNSRDRRIATLRLRREDDNGAVPKSLRFHALQHHRRAVDFRNIFATLADPKSYLLCGIYFSVNVAFSSFPVFEPVITEGIGYSAAAAQGLSALPHLFAFPVVLISSHISDRYNSRSIPIIGHALSALTGYALLALAPVIGLPVIMRYLCLFPIASGFFSAVTLTIAWTMNNQRSQEGRGTGLALINFIGQVGPFVGTSLYPERDKPFYSKGHAVCACFMGLVAFFALVLRWILQRQNSRNKAAAQRPRLDYAGNYIAKQGFAFML